MAYNVVCISSADGAGAEEIARRVAEALAFRLINEDVVARAASEANIDEEVVADVERRKSLVARLLEGFAAGTAPPDAVVLGQSASDSLRQVIRSVIEETAEAGNVVLFAHAASFALASRDDVLRVHLTASDTTRQQRLAGDRGVDEHEAARVMRQSDAGRADYLRRFYGVSAERPTHYDLVVNTDKLTTEAVSALIVDAVKNPA